MWQRYYVGTIAHITHVCFRPHTCPVYTHNLYARLITNKVWGELGKKVQKQG